ncbi:hypothetical protein SSX86_017331 [Deinandra increscens subsp. villosa]|uniref:PB1-like domain-containing protein n=1 Tax=Deinandra increscens subsp. villosa TaxID=3103831 RepID=A0AAP0CUW2_9ASTR
MIDRFFFNLHYAGEIKFKPDLWYCGGLSVGISIVRDKMSFFELCDYAEEYGKYQRGCFSLHWVVPGMCFDGGLLPLNDDNDVASMIDILGDEFDGVVSLYVNPVTPDSDDPITQGIVVPAHSTQKAQPNSEAHSSPSETGSDSEDVDYIGGDESHGSEAEGTGSELEEDDRSVRLDEEVLMNVLSTAIEICRSQT